MEEYFLLVDDLPEGPAKAAVTAITQPLLTTLGAAYDTTCEGIGLFPLQASLAYPCYWHLLVVTCYWLLPTAYCLLPTCYVLFDTWEPRGSLLSNIPFRQLSTTRAHPTCPHQSRTSMPPLGSACALGA